MGAVLLTPRGDVKVYSLILQIHSFPPVSLGSLAPCLLVELSQQGTLAKTWRKVKSRYLFSCFPPYEVVLNWLLLLLNWLCPVKPSHLFYPRKLHCTTLSGPKNLSLLST